MDPTPAPTREQLRVAEAEYEVVKATANITLLDVADQLDAITDRIRRVAERNTLWQWPPLGSDWADELVEIGTKLRRAGTAISESFNELDELDSTVRRAEGRAARAVAS